jgi:regulator of sigma E protease
VGMCLMAALDPSQFGNWVIVILQVAFALGFVIFVHELGHFLVARMCGVKCEKFMIGFDVGGYKLSRQWGETEYGIGILPFGGYVKMLGQDDNPANIAEQVRESQVHGDMANAKEITGPNGEKYWVDRRSYLAKSVPQRMAIISAGVVMNVIFAFIFATIAYKIGVPYIPSIISQTAPGSPAWQADIRPGDELVQVADIVEPSFDELRGNVILGDLVNGIPFKVRRGGETLEKRLTPELTEGDPARIGVVPPWSLRLHPKMPAFAETPAGEAKPSLEGGDEVVAVDGQPLESYVDLAAYLAAHPEIEIVVQVRRGGEAPKDDPEGPRSGGELIDVAIAPRPLRTLGMTMQMGKIVAVQEGSPADEAGIKPGDFIDKIEVAGGATSSGDQPALSGDPMLAPEELRRLAEEDGDVKLSLRRASTESDNRGGEPITVPLRRVTSLEQPVGQTDPLSAPALGVAYRVLSIVDEVTPGGPADKAGIEPGDQITQAEFVFPEEMKEKPRSTVWEFGPADGEPAHWAALMARLQDAPKGTQLKLTLLRGKESKTATIAPTEMDGYFVPERGFAFEWVSRTRIAESWGDAARRGFDETISAMGMVYRFLSKLGGQVPLDAMGGPITIAQVAGFSAFEGVGKLLIFLTMLSANLAVINFLPIPLLDGGHIVFLAWEGIRGKPASEKFVVAMHTIGFVFIITLMLFVISNDVRRLLFA